ncbi:MULTISPECIES: hypothetical protein [unclassified Spirillospora]|uniref:hypothetical protein n=1 Tax=unclassified Spirillospora TaxID=2642701 RepID=UPI0037192B04
MNTEPRAAPPAGRPDPALPCWAVKPVRQLTAGELAEALGYLERHRPDDDVLGRALAGEFARRTAAAEFAHRTAAGRADPTGRGDPAGPEDVTGRGDSTGPVGPPWTPSAPEPGGARRPRP